MKAQLVVYFAGERPEEHAILHGVHAYVRDAALAWEVIPCVELRQGLIDRLVENEGGPVFIIGRGGKLIQSCLRPGVRWVDYAYSHAPPSGDAHIMFDPEAVGRVSGQYLLSMGARVGVVKGPLPAAREEWEPRTRSFFEVFEKEGRPCFVLREKEWPTHEAILQELKDLVSSAELPLGIFMINDDDGKFMLRVLAESGIAVPEQAMVMGGSGNALSAYQFPSLTTVRLPFFSLGRAAALQVHRLLTGADIPSERVPVLSVVARDSTNRDSTIKDTVIRKAIRRVEQKKKRIPTVDELARYCQVHRSVLLTHFNRHLGMTPKEWLLNQSMQRAIQLLTDTEETLEKIARRCGYQQSTSFIYRFKKYFSVTPERYRQQCR